MRWDDRDARAARASSDSSGRRSTIWSYSGTQAASSGWSWWSDVLSGAPAGVAVGLPRVLRTLALGGVGSVCDLVGVHPFVFGSDQPGAVLVVPVLGLAAVGACPGRVPPAVLRSVLLNPPLLQRGASNVDGQPKSVVGPARGSG